jgi:BirA family transcriptional regulator, biotin operon repressor / biotin---[acetyl-CoA-carboxylase] ligase
VRARAARAAAGPAALDREPLIARVFAALADGRFHSGEDLAERFSVSRSAVWKAAGALRSLGATLHAVRNRGYQLPKAGEPLDGARIRARLPCEVQRHVARIDTAWSVSSTNTVLLSRPNPVSGETEVLLAEYQTAGRGRRGRSWLAPPGGAICLSLSWTFTETPAELAALGLVIGVCTQRALQQLGIRGARLKWPNDLLIADEKLGGILIELRAETAGPACVIIGIGLNVALGAALFAQIEETGTTATDLASASAEPLSRNEVAACVIGSCIAGLLEFSREGLKPFLAAWREADALAGRPVSVSADAGTVKGLARGIDLHGAFLLETPDGVKRFVSGDVTVRAD